MTDESLYLMSPLGGPRSATSSGTPEPLPRRPAVAAASTRARALEVVVRRAAAAAARAAWPSPAGATRRSCSPWRRTSPAAKGCPTRCRSPAGFPDVAGGRRAARGRSTSSATSGCATGTASTLADELDVVGPIATEHLRAARRRLAADASPATSRSSSAVRGGIADRRRGRRSRCSGAAHRIAPLAGARARRPRPPCGDRARPCRRCSRARRRGRGSRAAPRRWTRPPVRGCDRPASTLLLAASAAIERVAAAVVRHERPHRSCAAAPRCSARRNRAILAAPYDVGCTSPLLHPDVVHALARDGRVPRSRRPHRRAASLAPDLLPDARAGPHRKATFTSVLHGVATPVRSPSAWDGTAASTRDLVDAEAAAPRVAGRRADAADGGAAAGGLAGEPRRPPTRPNRNSIRVAGGRRRRDDIYAVAVGGRSPYGACSGSSVSAVERTATILEDPWT